MSKKTDNGFDSVTADIEAEAKRLNSLAESPEKLKAAFTPLTDQQVAARAAALEKLSKAQCSLEALQEKARHPETRKDGEQLESQKAGDE